MRKHILVVHAFATVFMVGLIWFVQIVHYPLFVYADPIRFTDFVDAYSNRTAWIVVPVMLVELASACALVWRRPACIPASASWIGMALLAGAWTFTFSLQVPQHLALAKGFDAQAHAALVSTNWFRTACWTARGLLALWMVSRARDIADASG